MSEPVIWQGQELPQARGGNVWALYMYPGGRKELRQCPPVMIDQADDAAWRLQHGRMARIWLDDATLVIALLPDNHPIKGLHKEQHHGN